MLLPEPNFAPATLHHEQLYLGPNHELNNVFIQGNPVYLSLVLPGAMEQQVNICFPAPGAIRIYDGLVHDGRYTRKDDLVREVLDEFRPPKLPRRVRYRYGMQLKPWMFFCWLDRKMKSERAEMNNTVNYIVLNCTSGHSGVVISVFRVHDSSNKHMEWMEIYSFQMGNNSDFAKRWQADRRTRLMARFIPKNVGTAELVWKSQ